jgi:hypothetical protein
MPIATFAVALAMIASPFFGNNKIDSQYIAYSANASHTVLEASVYNSLNEKTTDKKIIEEKVRTYFKDTPILAEIAFCESSFKHYDQEGEVVRGKVDSRDVGLMQINERYHLEKATELGFDIYSIAGNLAYAEWLYERQGTAPWKASSPCWYQYL